MSRSIAPTLIIIFMNSLLIFTISTPTAASSSALIKKACSTGRENFDVNFCIHILQSQPTIASATNLFDLSIGIINSGIAASTNLRTHVESVLKKGTTDPNLRGALQDCKSSYDAVIVSLGSALGETKEKEYETATYDLLLAGTDNIQVCENIVASRKVKDEIILSGNKIVSTYGLSAYEAVEALD